ncbi:MAG: ferredoxin [Actinobacteria bacterium]|nr:ferredoxin [Actinomycetota bacterium]MCL5887804.1 ferredoxin [Actinomycetota bacterium]
MKAVIDKDRCVGCGECEEYCPEAFRVDESGIAIFFAEEMGAELYGTIRDCADICPVEAIMIVG